MSDAVPAWAHEKAEVLPYDPRLADRARTERGRLARSLGPWLVDGVEHVGSTAVPGLAAKPVIDLMASVTDPDVVVAQAGERLAADGWCYVPPELDGGGLWRRFFVSRTRRLLPPAHDGRRPHRQSPGDHAKPQARSPFNRAASIALCCWSQHNAAMATSITIRDVPDETRDELAARAAATGRSLQEYLRSKLIDLARQPDAEALLTEVRARKAATAPALPRDRILAHQLEDRR